VDSRTSSARRVGSVLNPTGRLALGLALVLTLALSLVQQPARADGVWEGFWEAYSYGDDAFLSMRQEGQRVTGAYFPYDGRIEGTADNGVLRGTWRSPNGSGTFVFTLSPDGESFSGVIGAGDWWNGRRIAENEISALTIDLATPGRTTRSFMQAGRAVDNGATSGLQAMFSALHFGRDVGFAEKSRRARLLHDVLSLTTFRVFEIRPTFDAAAVDAPVTFSHRFRQRGTDEGISLEFRRDLFGIWRIDAPDSGVLKDRLQRLLGARGLQEMDPTGYRRLANPRHAMEAFVEGMRRWEVGGQALVRRAFNLSAVSERLREGRLPVLASFMAANLNRIGHLTLEEIPDDPESNRPVVFYEHSVGNIEIAPYTDADGTTRWQFTPATLAAAQQLNDALRGVPVTFDNVPNPLAGNLFFTIRSLAYDVSPALTDVTLGIEHWQWLGLFVLALLLPLILHLFALPIERRLLAAHGGQAAVMRNPYSVLVRLLMLGGLWLFASIVLGLPDGISSLLNAFGWLLVIIAVTWQLFLIVNMITRGLHRVTSKTRTTLDDVAVSLLSGLVKVLLIIGAAIAIADVLGMPYETVLAGVGISGLAFAIASRDVIANLFGSAIIAADRPFQRGDFITVGGVSGTVEKVGLRSTRLRPLDDTTVTMPNSLISTDQVVNISKRRQIRAVETIHIDHDSSLDDLRALRERMREELLADDMVSNDNLRVGLSTISLYAVEIDLAFYVKTNDYDEFLYEKHRLLVQLLSVIESVGVRRAVIRKE
jgi:small-conductance mechanosensitive channel